ncbi:hypothetical protein [Pedosphaera parvula]|uniref:Uncharacterized protein n=1 Tax=Pedosphaera parvula (strain Ellin514) TaxID=320771 RepID=B9XCH0_PEDPL|nr:hypothetical protein [Pedosphaera parvula]EEF62638.1 hypothetical protein Cflav_PD5273 [Pedosphaera parvula Ellin514]
MTKQEFTSRNQARARAVTRDMVLSLSLFIIPFFACLAAFNFVERHEEYAWMNLVLAAIMLALFPALLWLATMLGKRRNKRFGLHCCPECKKPLTGINVQLAIASGNCGHCDKSIFNK